MSINGNGDTLTIKGAKLKVSGGVQVSGSIAYTEDATGFGGVAAVIDTNNTRLNITAGKTSGVAKIEHGTTANITAVDHTNVSNNTTIHIALKNTSTRKGDFVTLGLFANDDTVKVNYTDEYVISPGETGLITARKVAGILSLFVREMFTSTTTDTTSKPFYIKDGTNYKYPLYTTPGGNTNSVTINGTTYYEPSGGYTTKTRPPKGIPELIVSPSGNLAIGNNANFTTIHYDVWGVPLSFDFGSIYQGSTKKASFLLENGESSGSFTESGASSGDAYSLYVERTDTSTSDTISQTSGGGWTGVVAFHHDTFANSGDPYGDGTLAGATANNHVFADTQTGTYTWGTLSGNTLSSANTTYTWTPPNDITDADVLMVAGGGGGGGGYEGGGGGAGGYKNLTGQYIENSNTIVVGNGGSGYISTSSYGSDGANSSFGSTSVLGGGRGSSSSTANAIPNTGGSGGGGSHGGQTQLTGASGTLGQGNAGGDGLTEANNWAGGGGGGAGGVGGDASSSAAGTGGTGVTNDILGISIEFAKGGDGGRRPQNSSGTAGTKHRGNGGGGGGNQMNGSGGYYGGNGGSGIVIIKSAYDILGKKIPKVTGASFDSTNVTFTVQDTSNITNIKYTINGGSEQTTPVGTLAVAHNLSATSITVVAYAVDANGDQISTKKTVTGTIP